MMQKEKTKNKKCENRVLAQILEEIGREKKANTPKAWDNWTNWTNWQNWVNSHKG